MANGKKFLVDVGMRDVPFPIKALSKTQEEGQPTIANISVTARIMQEFETRWIDRFIKVLHQHRDNIEPTIQALKGNIKDYLEALNARWVSIVFEYPFFIAKQAPVSKESCLVRYPCTCSAKTSIGDDDPTILFKMIIPAITTYPMSDNDKPGGLFGQLSNVEIEMQSTGDIYPEDVVAIVDRHALSPVFAYLAEEDQHHIIEKVHSVEKTSVVMTDEIRNELARRSDIQAYSIRCSNFGMLHPYSTVVGTEKGMWVPFSSYNDDF